MKRVFIVDDSDFIRKIVRMTLEKEGHEVTEEADGAAGLKTIKEKGPFDLIISDINMPEMTGLEMVEQVRKEVSLKSIPIILLTTESEESLTKKSNELGVEKWMVKPFQPNDLILAVKEFLG